MGFHSPQEAQRVLAMSLDKASKVRLMCSKILAKHGYTKDVVYPDYSTKEKAKAVDKLFQEGKAPPLLAK
jgi:nitrite reductase (cytochrome c-552)